MDGEVSSAPYRRSPDSPPDQEMAEGRCTRRWGMVGDEEGDAARFRDFTAALQRLPTLRLRSLGPALEEASGRGGSHRGPLRGRYGAGIPVSRGRGTIPPRMERAAAEVRTGTSSGQNPPD